MRCNIFSFFSGAGFLDLGFELEGHFDIVYVNEINQVFNNIYRYARQNMGLAQPKYGHSVDNICNYLSDDNQDKLESLLKLVEDSKKDTLTGFIGGPPCPDFSVAGKNKGRDGIHGHLSGVYTDLISKAKPDFFLFENVKGLYRTARHREYFEELKKQFRDNGYSLTERLINSLEYGAPQDRDRIILIGFHQNVIDKLNLSSENSSLVDFPWQKHILYDINYVKQLPWPEKDPYKENGFLPMPQGIIEELTVKHWWDKNNIESHPNSTMYFQPRAGLARFQEKAEGDVEKKCYKRLHRWRFSPTAAYGNNEVHIHPFLPRRISVAESLAIQSLPKDFVLPTNVTLTDAFKSIGNGVPFIAAKCIAETIYDYIITNNQEQ